MLHWIKRFPAVSQAVEVSVAWVTFFGLVAGAMTWVATSITGLYQYGWGAVVFAGTGVACVIILVISAAIAASRYFNPLPAASGAKSNNIPLDALRMSLNEQIQELASKIDEFEIRATALDAKIDKQATEQLKINRTLDGMFGTIDGKVEDQSKDIQQLAARVQSDCRQSVLKFEMLTTALRARDAETILKEADKVISSFGPKLIRASAIDYPDQKIWLAGYGTWNEAMAKIDNLLVQWFDHQKPFLDIRRRDYENSSETPPNSIKTDDTIMPYKTVCLAQPQYEKQRENMFAYFSAKAGTLPG
jgi:hypothetical protein